MTLDDTDLLIMLALIEKPLATDQEIRKIILSKPNSKDVSISTINRRIKQLFQADILHGAVPEINYWVLGLELHTFVITVNSVEWEKNASTFKKFCDYHPYTNYQCRIYGASNGIYVQFILPSGGEALEYLLNSFNLMVDKSIIVKFLHCERKGMGISTPIELNNIHIETPQTINFDKITEELQTNTIKFDPKKEQGKPILEEIQPLDLIIIRELTRNSRRSQSEILKFIKEDDPEQIYQDYFNDQSNPISKQTFSRRYNYIMESGLISHFELAYNRFEFGMFNQALYIGTNDDPIKLGGLKNSIEKGYIPYPCRLTCSENNFVFWVNLPPVELIHFPDKLLNNFKNLKIFLFGRFPSKYYFYHKNFNFENRTWNISKQWIHDEPLQIIGIL